MVLSYIPLGLHSVCDYLRIHEKKYVNEHIYKKFEFYFEKKYCKHTLTRGKNKGFICGRKAIEDEYCKQHYNNVNDIDNKYIYCSCSSIRRSQCRRLVKNEGDVCSYHNKKMITVKNTKNNKSLLLFKIITKLIILLNTTRKKQKYIEEIRNIELINILNYLKIDYSFEGSTLRTYNNIVINNNKYYDNRNNKGGGGAIDLYMYLTKKNFNDTIKELKNISKTNIFIFPSSHKNNKKIYSDSDNNKKQYSLLFENVIENKNNINNIKRYLIDNRKIDNRLIEHYINKGFISSDNKNNCIFYDENRKYMQLKGITSNKFISSLGKSNFIEYKNNVEPLYLFESPIDALSFISINNCNINGNFVSINGSMMINKIFILVEKYKLKSINLCFDNDNQGEEFCKNIKEQLKPYNIEIIRHKSKYKDWNEDLQKQ